MWVLAEWEQVLGDLLEDVAVGLADRVELALQGAVLVHGPVKLLVVRVALLVEALVLALQCLHPPLEALFALRQLGYVSLEKFDLAWKREKGGG